MEGRFERALGAHVRIAADIHGNSCSLIIRTFVKTLVFALQAGKTHIFRLGLYNFSHVFRKFIRKSNFLQSFRKL